MAGLLLGNGRTFGITSIDAIFASFFHSEGWRVCHLGAIKVIINGNHKENSTILFGKQIHNANGGM
ncbi:hypothetical protein J2736_001851 [Paenibacillus qinlingensis]|uniref:Uncharacterized protein n=1 Tax=Paenibacillus qinlingensis TaxID=1837343 RepID=A0ABU1NT77_9BACL|nr:hypothetical protein [Paenibacillus qinlingensis]